MGSVCIGMMKEAICTMLRPCYISYYTSTYIQPLFTFIKKKCKQVVIDYLLWPLAEYE